MRFGTVPVGEAEGALLAHSLNVGAGRLRKAHRLTKNDITALHEAGLTQVIVARLDPHDIAEDDAARQLAEALRTVGVSARDPATGRVNLHALHDGLFCVDRQVVDAINAVDPALTLATLAPDASVRKGQIVATVKVIPFAVPDHVLRAVGEAAAHRQAFAVHAFRPHRVALIQTTLPVLKPSILDKTARVTAARLTRSQSHILDEWRVPHETATLAGAIGEAASGSDLVLIFGASALCDPADVLPAAIEAAGGDVLYTGMPVDPGNLLVLGFLDGRYVLGAPGCARSPSRNGLDLVLDRITCGIDVTGRDIAAMGVGGLLSEIPSRPQPREKQPSGPPRVHAAILAAGRSTRMGGPNKLLALFDEEPLIRRVARRVGAAPAASVCVIIGHQGEAVRAALSGLDVAVADNPDFAAGLSTSLKVAINAMPPDAAGLLVVLGDMPAITTQAIARMIEAFERAKGTTIVRATHDGKRGNPVILPRALLANIDELDGDIGARAIVEAAGDAVIDVELGAAASLDVDTPEALRGAGGIVEKTD